MPSVAGNSIKPIDSLGSTVTEDPHVSTITLGLQQLVERHLLSYERFDHSFSLMKFVLERRRPSETVNGGSTTRVVWLLRRLCDESMGHPTRLGLLPITARTATQRARGPGRVVAALAQSTDERWAQSVLKVSSMVCPDDSVDAEELLVMADERLAEIELAEPSNVRRGHLRLTA